MADLPHALIREEIKEREIESHAPYLKVFLGLAILTLIEYVYARIFKDYSTVLIVGLIFWAVVKAGLVGWYFMHLKFEGKWIYLVLIPVGILAVIVVTSLIPDVAFSPGNEAESTSGYGHSASPGSGIRISLETRIPSPTAEFQV